LEQRLQVAELQCGRVGAHDLRRVVQALGGLELALGVDDLRASLALGLRLARHRALHALRDPDVLDLDRRDLDAPRVGLLVDDLLQRLVEALALGEQHVEVGLAEHGAQRRLRDLRRRGPVALDLDHGLDRVDDAEVRDGVDLRGDVVARDQVLRRDVERDRAQVDADHAVDAGDEEDDPRALLPEQAAEAEHDGAFVLAQDPDRRARNGEDDGDDDDESDEDSGHRSSSHSSARRTDSVRPLTRSTTTGSPAWKPPGSSNAHGRAFQSAPSTNTCPTGCSSWRTTPTWPTRPSAPVFAPVRETLRAPRTTAASVTPAISARSSVTTTTRATPPPDASTAIAPPATSETTPSRPRTPAVGRCASATMRPAPARTSTMPKMTMSVRSSSLWIVALRDRGRDGSGAAARRGRPGRCRYCGRDGDLPPR